MRLYMEASDDCHRPRGLLSPGDQWDAQSWSFPKGKRRYWRKRQNGARIIRRSTTGTWKKPRYGMYIGPPLARSAS